MVRMAALPSAIAIVLGLTLLVRTVAGAPSISGLRDGGVFLRRRVVCVRLTDGQYAGLLLVRVLVHVEAGDEVLLVDVEMAQALARPIVLAK